MGRFDRVEVGSSRCRENRREYQTPANLGK